MWTCGGYSDGRVGAGLSLVFGWVNACVCCVSRRVELRGSVLGSPQTCGSPPGSRQCVFSLRPGPPAGLIAQRINVYRGVDGYQAAADQSQAEERGGAVSPPPHPPLASASDQFATNEITVFNSCVGSMKICELF